MNERTDGNRGTSRHLAAGCLISVGIFAMFALVVLPEGTPSVGSRVLALVALAVASLVALAVARWAPGWVRGLGMLLVGFASVALLLGVVAERLLRRPTVPAVLGLVAGLAGITLIVLGWRRLLAGLQRRWVRVVTAVVGTLAVMQVLLLPAVVALMVTNRARPEASGRTPADLGLTFEDVRIPVADGTELAAWWVPADGDAAVLVLPGSGSTRDDVLDHGAFLAETGYGVLLLDVRGHGDSGGRIMDLGWGAERDVADVVSWLGARGVDRVGVLGLSMGGEVALTAAAEDPRIAAVVAEGATARTHADGALVPEDNPVAQAVDWIQYAMIRALTPESEPVPLVDAVANIDAPVLLIEGSGPKEPETGPLLAEAAPATLTLWEIPESVHVGGLSTRPQEYRQRVLELFDRALG